jgi:hypothetical protein
VTAPVPARTAEPTPVPASPGRWEWLIELLFGVELPRPLRCPSCRWPHPRIRLGTLRRLAAGGDARCTACSFPITITPTKGPLL